LWNFIAAHVLQTMTIPALPECHRQNERLTEIRCRLDALANQHCQAFFNNEPGPDLAQITGLLKEVDVMYNELGIHERAKADMMVGCGWHMLGQDDKAFDPLMRAVASDGCMSASDQLSAILVVMPLLRKKCQWRQIIEAGDKARKLAAGVWVDPVLPFLKGMALERLKCTEQAANHLEESIAMKPGFRQAHLEFQQAASELDDVERCRRVAQLLVDQGGYWVNCLQRPLHFTSNPKVRSQPWYDPQLFELVHALEKNFHAIRGELEAFNKSRWSSVGSAHRGNENSRHDADLVSTGEWREVVLLGDSDECEENCRECPMTAELLRSFSEVSQCAEMRLGESLFSQLLPGTRLRSHCGPSNLRLTCHLGIRIPSGCKIVCGGEPCCWEEGKCIVFDDSFEHEVLHEGDEARTVLLVNFWHPDVPPEMRHGLMSAARSPHDLAA